MQDQKKKKILVQFVRLGIYTTTATATATARYLRTHRLWVWSIDRRKLHDAGLSCHDMGLGVMKSHLLYCSVLVHQARCGGHRMMRDDNTCEYIRSVRLKDSKAFWIACLDSTVTSHWNLRLHQYALKPNPIHRPTQPLHMKERKTHQLRYTTNGA